jgi:hypothetical protein
MQISHDELHVNGDDSSALMLKYVTKLKHSSPGGINPQLLSFSRSFTLMLLRCNRISIAGERCEGNFTPANGSGEIIGEAVLNAAAAQRASFEAEKSFLFLRSGSV